MKLRIQPRMVAGFLGMSCLLIVVGLWTIYYTDRMQSDASRMLAENVYNLKYAEELEIALLDMKGLTANYLLDGQQVWLDIFENKKAAFIRWFELAKTRAHQDEDRRILAEIDKLFTQYLNYQKKVIYFNRLGNSKRAKEILLGEFREVFNKIFDHCEEFLFLNEKMMSTTSQKIENDNRMINRMMVGISIFGIGMALILGIFLARGIKHSIYELVLKVRGATDRELVEKLDIENETELEHLDKHIRRLIERVHAVNQDLERSQLMLIRAEKLAALGRMAAGLAHEIRNPLTAIKMLIFTLQNEEKKNSLRYNDYSVILKEIKRMETFMQNFLDFARPPEPDFKTVDVHKILKQTLDLISSQCKNGQIVLIENLMAKDAMVYADQEQLHIVFVNIILNAIQSISKTGTVTLQTIQLQNKEDAKSYFQISISDTGIGIPDAIKDSLFDPFVTGKEGGSGLGLSIANQIIAKHGGWIEAYNNPDHGATFVVVLPQEKKS